MCSEEKLKRELQSFKYLWKGGTNLSKRGWEQTCIDREDFLDLNGIVNTCISPFVRPSTVALEIGCGGGGWTEKLLSAKEIYCLDALSAEHNNFLGKIQKQDKVHYFQVSDFTCKELPNNSIDYIFSYDVFCHISYTGACTYLRNLYPKLKKGANCFIMIADAGKYRDERKREMIMGEVEFSDFQLFVADYDGPPVPGRWYFYGLDLFCNCLKTLGYTLVSKDVAVELDKLNPIVHFKK